jgi:hypothetical protein
VSRAVLDAVITQQRRLGRRQLLVTASYALVILAIVACVAIVVNLEISEPWAVVLALLFTLIPTAILVHNVNQRSLCLHQLIVLCRSQERRLSANSNPVLDLGCRR